MIDDRWSMIDDPRSVPYGRWQRKGWPEEGYPRRPPISKQQLYSQQSWSGLSTLLILLPSFKSSARCECFLDIWCSFNEAWLSKANGLNDIWHWHYVNFWTIFRSGDSPHSLWGRDVSARDRGQPSCLAAVRVDMQHPFPIPWRCIEIATDLIRSLLIQHFWSERQDSIYSRNTTVESEFAFITLSLYLQLRKWSSNIRSFNDWARRKISESRVSRSKRPQP